MQFFSPLRPIQPPAGSFNRISHILNRTSPLPRKTQPVPDQLNLSSLQSPDQLFRPRPLPSLQLFVPPIPLSSTTMPSKMPEFKTAGKTISQVAEHYGYRRGQVIRDKSVIKAMLNKAGELYGIPGDFLYRTAYRESGAKHWDKAGNIRSGAAVGMMQIEKSAHPQEVRGGSANALNNAYDLGNNMALGAKALRRSLEKLATDTGYTGHNPWQDLAPLLNISYNAGGGALKKVMNKARQMGLNPFDWQHLAFGRNVSVPSKGRFQVPSSWIETAPLHLALKEIHDSRTARGIHNYPIYWRDSANIRLHDFDQNGVTTRAERLISRIVFTLTGTTLKAR